MLRAGLLFLFDLRTVRMIGLGENTSRDHNISEPLDSMRVSYEK